MATLVKKPITVGSTVYVKERKRTPDGWHHRMLKYCGMHGKVIAVAGRPRYTHDYVYTLDIDTNYSWRHLDLVVVKMATPNPNQAFRMKKRYALRRT